MNDIENKDEMLSDFYLEADQLMEQVEVNILALYDDGETKTNIDEIFRAFHTLKGSASIIELEKVTSYTHHVEDFLDKLRIADYYITKDILDELYGILDIVKTLLSGEDLEDEILEDSLNGLKALLPSSPTEATIPTDSSSDETVHISSENLHVLLDEVAMASPENFEVFNIKVAFASKDDSYHLISLFKKLSDSGQVLQTIPSFESMLSDDLIEATFYYSCPSSFNVNVDVINSFCFDSLVVEKSSCAKIKINTKLNKFATNQTTSTLPKVETKEHETKTNINSNFIKIESDKVEYLFNLNSEVMVIKNSFNMLQSKLSDVLLSMHRTRIDNYELLHKIEVKVRNELRGSNINIDNLELEKIFIPTTNIFNYFETLLKETSYSLKLAVNELNKVSNESHSTLLKLRMSPISRVFNRFPRLVRDLSKKLGKSISLEIIGREVELDKSVIEILYDVILHTIRNSIDHGIESKEERLKQGKNAVATISLKALNQGNNILIEISDDGKGINEKKVREKAIERGLIKEDAVLTKKQVYDLIMSAGFSTVDNVSAISGRGVGMDVLKSSIESINGEIIIASKDNEGTTIRIKLPLTLSIIQSLMINVEDEIYAMPINNIVESFYINTDDISFLNNHEVLSVDSKPVPVFYLRDLFNIRVKNKDKSKYYAIIIESQNERIALLLDKLISKEDVILKSLTDDFTNVLGVSGTTIMGDGSICLIIDTMQIFQLSHNRQARLK